MNNMWLHLGSREASGGWEWHFMDRLSLVLCLKCCAEHSPARFRDKWKDVQRRLKQALESAGCSTSQPSLSTVAWTKWIKLSPTKQELCHSHSFSLHPKQQNSVQPASHSSDDCRTFLCRLCSRHYWHKSMLQGFWNRYRILPVQIVVCNMFHVIYLDCDLGRSYCVCV